MRCPWCCLGGGSERGQCQCQPGCRSPGAGQGVPQHRAVVGPWAGAWVQHGVAGEEQRPGVRAASCPELHYPVLPPISEKLTSNKRAL